MNKFAECKDQDIMWRFQGHSSVDFVANEVRIDASAQKNKLLSEMRDATVEYLRTIPPRIYTLGFKDPLKKNAYSFEQIELIGIEDDGRVRIRQEGDNRDSFYQPEAFCNALIQGQERIGRK